MQEFLAQLFDPAYARRQRKQQQAAKGPKEFKLDVLPHELHPLRHKAAHTSAGAAGPSQRQLQPEEAVATRSTQPSPPVGQSVEGAGHHITAQSAHCIESAFNIPAPAVTTIADVSTGTTVVVPPVRVPASPPAPTPVQAQACALMAVLQHQLPDIQNRSNAGTRSKTAPMQLAALCASGVLVSRLLNVLEPLTLDERALHDVPTTLPWTDASDSDPDHDTHPALQQSSELRSTAPAEACVSRAASADTSDTAPVQGSLLVPRIELGEEEWFGASLDIKAAHNHTSKAGGSAAISTLGTAASATAAPSPLPAVAVALPSASQDSADQALERSTAEQQPATVLALPGTVEQELPPWIMVNSLDLIDSSTYVVPPLGAPTAAGPTTAVPQGAAALPVLAVSTSQLCEEGSGTCVGGVDKAADCQGPALWNWQLACSCAQAQGCAVPEGSASRLAAGDVPALLTFLYALLGHHYVQALSLEEHPELIPQLLQEGESEVDVLCMSQHALVSRWMARHAQSRDGAPRLHSMTSSQGGGDAVSSSTLPHTTSSASGTQGPVAAISQDASAGDAEPPPPQVLALPQVSLDQLCDVLRGLTNDLPRQTNSTVSTAQGQAPIQTAHVVNSKTASGPGAGQAMPAEQLHGGSTTTGHGAERSLRTISASAVGGDAQTPLHAVAREAAELATLAGLPFAVHADWLLYGGQSVRLLVLLAIMHYRTTPTVLPSQQQPGASSLAGMHEAAGADASNAAAGATCAPAAQQQRSAGTVLRRATSRTASEASPDHSPEHSVGGAAVTAAHASGRGAHPAGEHGEAEDPVAGEEALQPPMPSAFAAALAKAQVSSGSRVTRGRSRRGPTPDTSTTPAGPPAWQLVRLASHAARDATPKHPAQAGAPGAALSHGGGEQVDAQEERLLRAWLNSLLADQGVKVSSLFDATMCSGWPLLLACEVMSPGAVDWSRAFAPPYKNRRVPYKLMAVENGNQVCRICTTQWHLPLVNIGGIDIAEGHQGALMSLVWQLMRHHMAMTLGKLLQRTTSHWQPATTPTGGHALHPTPSGGRSLSPWSSLQPPDRLTSTLQQPTLLSQLSVGKTGCATGEGGGIGELQPRLSGGTAVGVGGGRDGLQTSGSVAGRAAGGQGGSNTSSGGVGSSQKAPGHHRSQIEEEVLRWANARLKGAVSTPQGAALLQGVGGPTQDGTRSPPHLTSLTDPALASAQVLLALLNGIRPGAVNPDHVLPGVTDAEREQNARYALSVARSLGCTLHLTWQDLLEARPRPVLMLLAELMARDVALRTARG